MDKMILFSIALFDVPIVVISLLVIINNNWITLTVFGIFTLVCIILVGKEAWNNTR